MATRNASASGGAGTSAAGSNSMAQGEIKQRKEAKPAAGPWPERNASVAGWLFFSWVSALMTKGNSSLLELDDLWEVSEDDAAKTLTARFERVFAEEVAKAAERGHTRPFWASLKRLLGGLWLRGLLWRLLASSFLFVTPVLIEQLLRYLEERSGFAAVGAARNFADGDGWYIVAGLVVSKMCITLCEARCDFTMARVALRARSIARTAVYRKSLRLAASARDETSAGQITNLMSTDASRLETMAMIGFMAVDALYQIIGMMTLLVVRFIGASAFAGFSLMVLLLPVQGYFMMAISKVQAAMATHTDERVKLTNEALQGMKQVKLYNWSHAIATLVEAVRQRELATVKSAIWLQAWLTLLMTASPVFVAVLSISVYSGSNGSMLPSLIFSALNVFSSLRFPIMFAPFAMGMIAAGHVSLKRIDRFLASDDVMPYAIRGEAAREAKAEADAAAVSTPAPTPGPEPDAPPAAPRGARMVVRDATFTWNTAALEDDGRGASGPADAAKAKAAGSTQVALERINLDLAPGSLTAVVGAVGSGKSTLCAALLGELHLQEGEVRVDDTVAYAEQGAFIVNDTLRNNILFGEAHDPSRYRRAVAACQLQPDIDLLPHGDETAIGERGINLSGGQRQRVSIARCMYSSAPVVVLDDPLSALDAEVGRSLFDQAIVGAMAGRTRVLVTNQLQFLERCDRVVVLRRDPERGCGVIAEQGAFTELMAKGLDLATMMASFAGDGSDGDGDGDGSGADGSDDGAGGSVAEAGEEGEEGEEGEGGEHVTEAGAHAEPAAGGAVGDREAATRTRASSTGTGGSVASPSVHRRRQGSTGGRSRKGSVDGRSVARSRRAKSTGDGTAAKPAADKLMDEEELKRGSVQARYYAFYIASGGAWFFSIVAVLFAFERSMNLLNLWWVALWTEDAAAAHKQEHDTDYYLTGYALFAVGLALSAFVRAIALAAFSIRAARALHERLMARVLRAPMSYFDTTPLGRILARFSKDMDTLTNQLPKHWEHILLFVSLLVSMFVGVVVQTPWFLVAMAVLLWLWSRILVYFRNVARELKRLDSVSHSPIFSGFGETLDGLSTIRAYGHGPRFTRLHYQAIDSNNSAWLSKAVVDRWLSVRLEILGSGALVVAAALALVGVEDGSLTASDAGFSLSMALAITAMMNWTVRSAAELEANMNSVERVAHTTEQTPQEAAAVRALGDGPAGDGVAPPAEWPTAGAVTVRDLKLRYRPTTPLVLKGLAFDVRGGDKIGIVGRTGSGKSSLMLALMRVVEPESGSILIDGVDVRKTGLEQLRGAISIIPQEPVMLSGSVRSNLDPLGLHEDERLWEVLGTLELQAVVVRQARQQAAADKAKELAEAKRKELDKARKKAAKARSRRAKSTASSASAARAPGGGPGAEAGAEAGGAAATADGFSTAAGAGTGAGGAEEDELAAAERALAAEAKAAEEAAAEAAADIGDANVVVEIEDAAAAAKEGLGARVQEGGSNFSVGQRQLLCLGRVMLRRSRILLLDEATSSVDHITDALIQRTIRQQFKSSTVLTIAHRIATIADSDRVLVLSQGSVVAFDAPQALLADRSSVFSSMVDELGPAAAGRLRATVMGASAERLPVPEEGGGALEG